MLEIAKNINIKTDTKSSDEIPQLKNTSGKSVFITDPEGNKIEIKTISDGTKIVFTKDENGKSLAIEERINGTKLYHISKDSTGLPSTHEIRSDLTELIYFYNTCGKLQHFVELKPNGDRISTLLNQDGSIYSIEQKQIGGIVFRAWVNSTSENENKPKQGMVWLHPDGELSTHGDEIVISDLLKRFGKFLDGVVEAR